jgi:hypothetical protein
MRMDKSEKKGRVLLGFRGLRNELVVLDELPDRIGRAVKRDPAYPLSTDRPAK